MKRFLKRAIKSLFTTYRFLTRICKVKAHKVERFLLGIKQIEKFLKS